MNNLLTQIAFCIEKGKADLNSPYPPVLKGENGASELTKEAIDSGISADQILKQGLMPGMNRIGERFSKGEAFIPDLLMSARAMNAAMEHLQPHFDSGDIQHRGTLILGTVAGDLHEIGKNVVRMVLEGDGWKVLDLGVDVTVERFSETLRDNPDSIIGMSALLTTTMGTMEQSVNQIKQQSPQTQIYVGGAPLTQEFSDKIGADGFFPDPHSFAKHLAAQT
ncbi:cobalamin-binding protein [candidate division LCP-89 bacterium B3_LCP]|uniref:Cobalamin-binding protein n=1 Tax=candidate division LCP-89 bacterium B3_LCP TaxID=2012998 RepID=A0A532USQ1_UNCL8|nr:MAG: cobalamin-binding protein [candidate division LCP-89 bacterium B3_LCP]